MSVKHSAEFTEMLVSPEYREAVNASFAETFPDMAAAPDYEHLTDVPDVDPAKVDTYFAQRELAETLALGAIKKHYNRDERAWELRRQSALAELQGTDLGQFNDYFQRQGGLAPEVGKTNHDLVKPNEEIIGTNSRILSLAEAEYEPLEFFSMSLDMIDQRKTQTRQHHDPKVGTGNYATALKLFTNKYLEADTGSVDRDDIHTQVNRCMKGLWSVAKQEGPNFLEMTNIYFAIRSLPEGTFSPRYTKVILEHTLMGLADFGNDERNGNYALPVLIGALGRLDVSEYGETAATIIDLALRKGKKFETSRDYLSTLRAISRLPATKAANRSFASFLAARNNLEEALDIDGCDDATEKLLKITDDVIDDPRLSVAAQQLAVKNMINSAKDYARQKREGYVTQARLDQMAQTVQRIRENASKI